ncbi:MAG: hypothetical protein ABSF47_01030 [Minisyncoccia bacterium]|jgi:hypothetical protein
MFRQYRKWLVVILAVTLGVLLTIHHNKILEEKSLVKMAALSIPSNVILVETENFIQPFLGKTLIEVPVSEEFLRNANGTVYYKVYTRQPAFNGIHDWIRLFSIQGDEVTYSDWDSRDEIVAVIPNTAGLQIYRYEFRYEKYLFWSWLAPILCFGFACVALYYCVRISNRTSKGKSLPCPTPGCGGTAFDTGRIYDESIFSLGLPIYRCPKCLGRGLLLHDGEIDRFLYESGGIYFFNFLTRIWRRFVRACSFVLRFPSLSKSGT